MSCLRQLPQETLLRRNNMEIKTSLGFTVEVDEHCRIELPHRPFTPAELKKIATEVNRAVRERLISESIDDEV